MAPMRWSTEVTTRPSIEEQRAMFDRWNRIWRSDSEHRSNEIEARAIEVLEYLDGLALRSPSILEVGCGTGWLTEDLCSRGRVWACDLSPWAIEYAKGRGLQAEFHAGDVLRMELPTTDVAIIFDTLFYIEDQATLIRRLATKARWLILSNINPFVFRRSSDVGPPQPGQIRHWLSIRETRTLLEPHFRVRRVSTVYPRRGDQGIMRVVQSRWLNRPFGWLPLDRIKNGLRLGAGVQILAEARAKTG